jgi:hypothetical protein
MFAVVWALAMGLAAATLVGWRARRPLRRVVAVALIGSYAGALAGALVGDLLAAVNTFPWVETGIMIGSTGGALVALSLDRRSAEDEEEPAESTRRAA